MKKLSILLGSAFILGLSLTSCSDDSSGSSVTEEKLVGKWNFSTTKFSGGGVSTPEEEYFGNETGCNADFYQLNENGTLSAGDYDSGCDLAQFPGTWSLDGKELTVVMGGSSTVYKVSSASSTKLVVVEEYSEGGFTFKETTKFVKAAQ